MFNYIFIRLSIHDQRQQLSKFVFYLNKSVLLYKKKKLKSLEISIPNTHSNIFRIHSLKFQQSPSTMFRKFDVALILKNII